MREAVREELRGASREVVTSLLTLGVRELVSWIRGRVRARRARQQAKRKHG